MSDSGLVITEATVKADWERLRKLERQAADARKEFGFQAAFLKAKGLGHWLPPDVETAVEPVSANAPKRSGRVPAERGTWTSEIIYTVRNAPEGIIRSELKGRLAEGPMAERMEQTPNGFYNGLAKLEKRGEIVDYKGRLFAPDLIEAFLDRVRRGEVPDLSGDGAPRTIIDALTDFVNTMPHGVEANEIVKAMKERGMAAGTVYNNLSKAVMKERIRREGKLYLPANENGPPEGGPDTGGARASPSEDQRRKLLL